MSKPTAHGASTSKWHSVKGAVKTAYKYSNGPGFLPFIIQLAVAFVVIKFVLFPVLGLLFGTQLPVVAVMSGSMEHDATSGIVCGIPAPADYSGSFDQYWSACGAWYEQRGITKNQFQTFPLQRGFDKGDIMVIIGPTRGSIEVGDTIVYQAREAYPIIHRVIAVRQDASGSPVYATKGDYNAEQIVLYVVSDAVGRVSACHRAGKPASCQEGERVIASTPASQAILDETVVPANTVIGRAIFRVPWLGWVKIWASGALGLVTGK